MNLNLKVKPKIHNRFDVYKNGKQVAYAENIILDAMWTRLCSGSTYFTHIRYGTGTGTLSSARTSLFTDLGYKAVSSVEKNYSTPTSYWRQSIELGLTDNNGAVLTEVGIAYGTGSSNLVTHAMLRDMNGNPVSITKTAVDILTIYATVYVEIDNSHPALKMIHPERNLLIAYLFGSTNWWTSVRAGQCKYDGDWPYGLNGTVTGSTSTAGTWTNDTANKRRTLATPRFGVNDANGHLVELVFAGSTDGDGIARLQLPASGIHAGLDIVGVTVGTGNGVTKTFKLPSNNIRTSTIVAKLDGVETTATAENIFDAPFQMFAPNISSSGSTYTTDQPSAISGDGMVSALGGSNQKLQICDLIGGCWRKRSVSPTLTVTPRYLRLNDDGSVIAYSGADGNQFTIADWSNGVWASRPTPASLPATIRDFSLSNDGNTLIVVGSGSPYIKVYDWSGSAWTARTNTNLPSAACGACSITANGNTIAVWCGTTVSVIDWSGSAWTARTTKTVASVYWADSIGGSRLFLNSTGTMFAALGANSPYAEIYDWVDNAWIARSGLSISNAVYGSAMTANGNTIFLAFSGYAFDVYDWRNASWIKRTGGSFVNSSGMISASADGKNVFRSIGSTAPGHMPIRYDNAWTEITFEAEPSDGAVITADYTVDGIHKTTTRVIDLTFTIQFGEPS